MKAARRYQGHEVLINLIGGDALVGTLNRVDTDSLELGLVSHVPAEGRPIDLDGTVVIPSARILWLQVKE